MATDMLDPAVCPYDKPVIQKSSKISLWVSGGITTNTGVFSLLRYKSQGYKSWNHSAVNMHQPFLRVE